MVSVLQGVNPTDPILRHVGQQIVETANKLLESSSLPKYKITNEVIHLAIDVYQTFYLPTPFLKNRDMLLPEALPQYDIISGLDYIVTKQGAHYKADSERSKLAAINFMVELMKNAPKQLAQEFTSGSYGKPKNEGQQKGQQQGKQQGQQKGQQQGKQQGQQQGQQQGKQQGQQQGQGQQQPNLSELGKETGAEAIEITNKEMEIKGLIDKIAGGAGIGSEFTTKSEGIEMLNKIAMNTNVSQLLQYLQSRNRLIDEVIKRLKQRPLPGRGEITGIKTGHELEDMIPSEMVYLSDEELQEEFLLRYAEGQILQYEKKYIEPSSIYVVIDKSGSMGGDRIMWAKAVALALLLVARREQRDYFVRFFDENPYPVQYLASNFNKKDFIKIFTYIASVQAGGGTSISAALEAAYRDIMSKRYKGISDVILITDGEDTFDVNSMNELKRKAKARLHSIGLEDANLETLKLISDYTYRVRALDDKNGLWVSLV